jgi:hypothetical protein
MLRSALLLAGVTLMTPGASRPAEPVAAQVKGNVVDYPGAPRLRVTVPAAARYLGADRFILKGVSDCEMHIFVEADAAHRVRRFYWVHFESSLPSKPEEHMHYADTDRRSTRWGSTIWISTEPAQTSRTPRPGTDTEHFRAIIRKAGYTMPPAMMTARLVRLLDDPKGTGYGRRELMLLYGEDMAAQGLAYDEVTTNGTANARWHKLEGPLLNRAEKAFDVATR